MKLRAGDLVLIRIEFPQAAGSKVRPAVVVLDDGDDDFVAAPVTSRQGRSKFDLTIVDWHAAGLNVPSVARLHKVATLFKNDIVRTVGRLPAADIARLDEALCRAYCPGERS
jgi:mRNA-degrading endonuclease toxin of MazEF toxin-antitoxin module